MSYSNGRNSEVVVPGPVPGSTSLQHILERKTWMAGTSPAMTEKTMIYKTEITSLRPCWIA
jgi:hypothetical protein